MGAFFQVLGLLISSVTIDTFKFGCLFELHKLNGNDQRLACIC